MSHQLEKGNFMSDVVNPQIIDAITQTNVKVLAEAPAMAMGSVYQTIGNSVAMAAANAVYAQQQANVTYRAATTLSVTKLFSTNLENNAAPDSINTNTYEQLQAQINALTAQLDKLKSTKPGS
jgi:hypothetical protein